MKTPDAFAAYHAHLIEAAYDCVDRLVVNCYYPLGQAGGGFRTFWRQDMSGVCPERPQTTLRVAREASCIREAYGESPKSEV